MTKLLKLSVYVYKNLSVIFYFFLSNIYTFCLSSYLFFLHHLGPPVWFLIEVKVHFGLIPDLEDKMFILSPLNIMKAIAFHNCPSGWGNSLLVPVCSEFSSLTGVELCPVVFLYQLKRSYEFLRYPINMENYIDFF